MTNKKNSRKQKQPRRRRQVAKLQSSPLVAMADMINDPCGATLTNPEYGASSSGYMIRHNSISVVDTTSGGNGYVIWFPDYASGGLTTSFNAVYFNASDANTAPINTTTNPLGSGATATASNGVQIRDPSYTWGATTTVQDTRTAAACMKMMYLGRNDALAGRVAVLENVPRDALLTGGGSAPPTVSEMFAYAQRQQRTSLDPLEVKFRPSDGSEHFRKTNLEQDSCFVKDAGTTEASIPSSGPTGAGLGIGFAWAGVIPGSDLGFDLVKVLEWRPEMISGIVAVPPTIKGPGGNLMSRAVALLDKQHPGWQTEARHVAKTIGAQVVSKAFEGSRDLIMRAAPMLLG